nr:aryl-sulfate sulfotransferase [Polyangiaceae bacterium]
VIYVLNEKDRTAQQIWADTEKKYMSAIMGDADRTSTGTILVLDSSLLLDPSKPYVLDTFSKMREVDRKTGEWVWTLRTPDHSFAYRAVPVTRVPGQAAVVGE